MKMPGAAGKLSLTQIGSMVGAILVIYYVSANHAELQKFFAKK
jgi:hypothetical protein